MSNRTVPRGHPGSAHRVPHQDTDKAQSVPATWPYVASATESGGGPSDSLGRRRVVHMLAAPLASVVVYFAVRPGVGSDAAALAVAGVIPAAYAITAVVIRRRVELWAVLTAASFAVGCVASLLAGGSSLPLKLHEAAVTFVLGIVLLVAVLARRPLPVSQVLKVPHAERSIDATLSVMVGSFLLLHALLHLALALILSTGAYLTAGRVVSWVTLGIGALCLWVYLRRLRRDQAKAHSEVSTKALERRP
jgi:hypothetical protein